jgi:hypothetical protein
MMSIILISIGSPTLPNQPSKTQYEGVQIRTSTTFSGSVVLNSVDDFGKSFHAERDTKESFICQTSEQFPADEVGIFCSFDLVRDVVDIDPEGKIASQYPQLQNP